jgi:fluoroacetyl-CoA thioesterase
MLAPFKPGDKKIFRKTIQPEDIASFESGPAHPVYSTFAIGRDAEWAGRLFVLEMNEEDEEGIGTFLKIEHSAPGFIGEEVIFEAIIEKLERNELICSFTVKCNDRLIASGETGQKILKRDKLEQAFRKYRDKA